MAKSEELLRSLLRRHHGDHHAEAEILLHCQHDHVRCKSEVAHLLQSQHDQLLRTLEIAESPDLPGGILKQPAFPQPPCVHQAGSFLQQACSLLHLGESATRNIWANFNKFDNAVEYNNAQALLLSNATAMNVAGSAGVLTSRQWLLKPLAAELALLQHLHQQRSLLLRCVRLLLSVALDSHSYLHGLAMGHVALMLQRGLSERLLLLLIQLDSPPSAMSRLPGRLQGSDDAIRGARSEWLVEIDRALALHAAKEKCDAMELLLLLRYLPLSLANDALGDLITSQSSEVSPSTALHQLLAGSETSSLEPLLAILAPIIAMPPDESALLGSDCVDAQLREHSKRTQELAAMVTIAAMQAEKEFCHREQARIQVAEDQYQAVTHELLCLCRPVLADAAEQRKCGVGATAASNIIGTLLLAWCAVVLEVASAELLTDQAVKLAVAAEVVDGFGWAVDLLHGDTHRVGQVANDTVLVVRQIFYDIVSGLIAQHRSPVSGIGWPAHSQHLVSLMAAVLDKKPQLCRIFWSHSLDGGALSSMLLRARYPLRAQPLPILLASLCAGTESLRRAWGFAHSLPRVSHLVPCRPNGGGVPFTWALQTVVASVKVGFPAIHLPVGATSCSEAKVIEESRMLIEWELPAADGSDMAPTLARSLFSLLSAGPAASLSVRRDAGASLALLVHAPSAHSSVELRSVLPPPAALFELIALCAQLPEGSREEYSILLLCLQLLVAVASVTPLALTVLIEHCPLFKTGASWLSSEHAPHALVLLELLQRLFWSCTEMGGSTFTQPLLFVAEHALPTFTSEFSVPDSRACPCPSFSSL